MWRSLDASATGRDQQSLIGHQASNFDHQHRVRAPGRSDRPESSDRQNGRTRPPSDQPKCRGHQTADSLSRLHTTLPPRRLWREYPAKGHSLRIYSESESARPRLTAGIGSDSMGAMSGSTLTPSDRAHLLRMMRRCQRRGDDAELRAGHPHRHPGRGARRSRSSARVPGRVS